MRGRKPGSKVRQNLGALLSTKKEAYAYELVHEYMQRFPKVSQRLIYYHLKKGVALGEFAVSRITEEEGNYSWGKKVERIYYRVNPSS